MKTEKKRLSNESLLKSTLLVKSMKCPRCQKTFQCQPDSIKQCQCSQVQLSPITKGYLQKNYSQCLCIKCLQELQDKLTQLKQN
ncbi:MAG: putative C2H2 Zn-finger protein [bacterium]|jgi:uncharacterized C2H2 Zn-finger protein